MASEQFSLCWDNFHKNMSSGMHSLLETEDLVDVTLAVEGKFLKAHKMVLSVCSPYFRNLFKANPCKHPIVFMKDVSYTALSDLLQFMYQGEVQVNQEHLTTFIKTAEALQIKGLTGDGNSTDEIENNIEDVKPEEPPKIKRPIQEVDPPKSTAAPRSKKPYGPLSKRQKTSASTPDAKAVSKTEVITSTPATAAIPDQSQSVQFKMEPYESSSTANLHTETEIDDSYADDTADEPAMDDTEDYGMAEGAEEEPQAGTSVEATGEGQDDLVLSPKSMKRKLNAGIVVDGFVYHINCVKGLSKMRYLVCSEYKRLVCRARAMIPDNGTKEELVITREHNHPPIEFAEERFTFMRELKICVQNNPTSSMKEIYKMIQDMCPEGASVCPFEKVIFSMRRWRNNQLKAVTQKEEDVEVSDVVKQPKIE